MGYYDLSKFERDKLVATMYSVIVNEVTSNQLKNTHVYFASEDLYIRKNAYLIIGKIYGYDIQLLPRLIQLLDGYIISDNELVRQTAVNAAGEIGKFNFEIVERFFDTALFDAHHKVRNAVIGSIKKMGQVNPVPVMCWAKKYLHHTDKEIRREICHGIELRGRTHPQDILPLLRTLEFDKPARVRHTLVHVIGQIAYKKGCLEIVVADLKNWQNTILVHAALAEIIDVHHRYRNFAYYTQEQAKLYIQKAFADFSVTTI